MFAFGTSVVLLELPLTVKVPAAVSTSPTVNESALVAVFMLVEVFAISLMVGASLTAVTVSTNVSVAVNVPSLTVTVIVAVPLKFVAGVTVTVRLAPEPPNTMLAFGTNVVSLDEPLTVSDATAVSASPTVNESALVAVSSFVDCAAISLIVGASLTAVTVNTNVSEVVNVPSLTVTVIVALPLRFAAGVTVTVRLAPDPPNTMFAFGTNVVSLDEPLTVNDVAVVSTSPIVNESALVAVSSFVDCAAISLIVGASLTAVTVKTKVSLAVNVPSLTVTVIVAVPLKFDAGVTVTVRFAPEPPNTMFAFGTNVVSLDVPLTVNEATAVSISSTVNESALVAVSSFVDCAAISLIVGPSFTALTVKTNVSFAVLNPSLTVTVIVAVPFWLAAGVIVTVRLAPDPPNTMFAFGTSVVLLDVPLTVSEATAVSKSPTVNAIALVAVSSFVDCAAISLIVGALFVFTVSKNVSEVVKDPSLTDTVIVADPDWLFAGVTVTVRFAPVPPNTMFAFGTSVVLLEEPLTVKEPVDVSKSPTVNESVLVAVFMFVDVFTISLMVGASLTALTVKTNVSEAVNVPSLTVTVIVAEPFKFATGVIVTVRLAPVPPNTMFAFGTNVVSLDEPLTVKEPAAVSKSPTVNEIALVAVSSFVDCAAISLIVGASFTAVTVNTNVSVAVNVPSLTVTVIVAVPLKLAAGVTVTVRFAPVPPNTIFAFGTNVVSLDEPLNVSVPAAVSKSPTVNEIALVAVSSFVDCAAISLIVGASLTAVTVNTNVSEDVFKPSLTVTVIVTEPFKFAAGVTVTVRFAPEPPNTMFAFGTSVVSLDEPLTAKEPAAVSKSPTVNAIAEVAVSSFVDCAAMSLIVGALFALTVNTNVSEAVKAPSLTVTVIVAVPD
jgi:hypothetical protein